MLRPGGWLCLVWNMEDEGEPLVAALRAVYERYDEGIPQYRLGAWKQVRRWQLLWKSGENYTTATQTTSISMACDAIMVPPCLARRCSGGTGRCRRLNGQAASWAAPKLQGLTSTMTWAGRMPTLQATAWAALVQSQRAALEMISTP